MKAKLSKILKYVGIILLILLISFTVIISSSWFQNYVAQKAVANLAKDLDTEISIGDVNVWWNGDIKLKNVLVRDREGDTMFFIANLEGDFGVFNNKKHLVQLNDLSLDGAIVNFVKYKGKEDLNYEFFINHFNPPRDPKKPKTIWTIQFDKLKLKNSLFNYEIEGKAPPTDRIFNESSMSYYNIDGNFEHFKIIGDSLDFKTNTLSCKEKSGVELKSMSALCKIHKTGMSFKELEFITNNSTLKDELTFTYNHWRSYSDFMESVTMGVSLKESQISFKDLAFFSNNLKSWSYLIHADGQAYGTISNFDAENIDISLLNNTRIKGDFSFMGLPDINNTFMDFNVERLQTVPSDLNKFIGESYMRENFKQLGFMTYQGNLTGFMRDFVTYGELDTKIGNIISDVNLKFSDDYKNATYKGEIKSEDFNLGQFYTAPLLGSVAMNVKIDGSGINLNDFNFTVNGNLKHLNFNNYHYPVSEIDGKFSSKEFRGKAIIKDENIDLDFNGDIDFTSEEPILNFHTDIRKVNLRALHLDSSDFLSATIDINTIGLDIDKFTGTCYIKNLEYHRAEIDTQSVEEIRLVATQKPSHRQVFFNSDIVNAEIEGNFYFKEMLSLSNNILHELLPLYFKDRQELEKEQDFRFRVNLIKPEIFTSIFTPDYTIGRGLFAGSFKSKNNRLVLNINNNKLGYKNTIFEGVRIATAKEPNLPMLAEIEIEDMVVNDIVLTSLLKIEGSVFNNSIDYIVDTKERKGKHELFTVGVLEFDSSLIKLDIGKSKLSILKKDWNLDSTANITYSNNKISIAGLKLQHKDQLLEANGIISKQVSDLLKVNTKSFELDNFNEFIPSEDIEIFGTTNGYITFSNLLEKPVITANLSAKNLAINEDTLGNLTLSSKFIRNNTALNVNADMTSGLLSGLKINGTISPFKQKENFDLKLKLVKGDLSVLENFTKGYTSNIKGKATISLAVKGEYNEPKISGQIDLDKAGFKVDYLNTSYTFSNKVIVKPDGLLMRKTKMIDSKGSSAMASGTLKHENFKDFMLDLKLAEVSNFMALNTKKGDNELYYGTAFIDGDMTVKGPIKKGVDIVINAESNRGTKIFLPLGDESSISKASYITFKKEDSDKPVIIKSGIKGINSLKINASVTPDAKMELIFDEQLGDKITGNGSGKLIMSLNSEGEFYLKGKYVIRRGEYLFTAMDVIHKKFYVKEGGSIEWTGDPYNANLDLTAYYLQETSPDKLLTSPNSQNGDNLKITVKNLLYLEGNLFSPNISFGMEFPNLNSLSSTSQTSDLQRVLKQIQSNPEELNRQTFSLLIFNDFLTPSFAETGENNINATSGLYTSFSELISNQIGNWLSKIDDKWKLDLDYKTGTQSQKEEFIIRLGRSFLDQRLQIDASYNASQTISPDFDISYNLTKDGKIKIKYYSRSSLNVASNSNTNTQGVGFYFQKEYYSRKRKNRIEKQEK